jgi:hypothetical protein
MTRTLPLTLAVPVASGSDPDVIEIEDAINVYGDFPEIDTPCDASPVDQCEYSITDNFRRCIYCGKTSGLDE